VPRITRREDEDPVPEAAQVMGELLQGDREAIEQWEGIAGEKADRQGRAKRDVRCAGCDVRGAKRSVTGHDPCRTSDLTPRTSHWKLFIYV
jgi:hypothetical protein